ncbi:hypothetical protein K1719_032071 [Acacia pycnantha]|nr:hypothetical protein K1719_032071 [Acacia pycnantha]
MKMETKRIRRRRKKIKDDDKKKREELDEGGFKVKEGFLFSNVEIERKEDVEKVQELVEKMNKKYCFLVCFSNVRVAQ